MANRFVRLCRWWGRADAWDDVNLGSCVRELEKADVVINLAGRSVNCRYNAANRHEILESRTKSTKSWVRR